MHLTIQEVARLAGTTSRTLRHYDRIGLLRPAGVGANGWRRYGPDEFLRLQRILLLRDMGIGLAQIAEMLDSEADPEAALRQHLTWLTQERDLLDRRIAAVERTVARIQRGQDPMADEMFDGFDHTAHREEVTKRWGADAYATGDRWWRELGDDGRAAFQREVRELNADWTRLAAAGEAPESPAAQALAARHVAWLRSVPGTPDDTVAYVRGLGDMYVADPRFARNYGDEQGAVFVRDALRAWADERA